MTSIVAQDNSYGNLATAFNTELITIATDSEWNGDSYYDNDGKWLVTTFAASTGERFLFANALLPEVTLQALALICDSLNIVFTLAREGEPLLSYVLSHLLKYQPKQVQLLVFYSPKDLEYSLGWAKVEELYDKGHITQRRSLQGNFSYDIDSYDTKVLVNVRDLKGWAGKQSLKDFCSSVGLQMLDKSALDDMKTQMRLALGLYTETFVKYAMDDTVKLLEANEAFVRLANWVNTDVIGIDYEFTSDSIPETTGSLVATSFRQWLRAQASDKLAFDWAVRKLGLLDTGKTSDYHRNAHSRLCRHVKTAEQLADEDNAKDIAAAISHAKYQELAYSQATVRHLGKITDDTAAFAAIVQGGRCVNERPTAYTVHLGADIDLKSCYGSALRSFTYPVGLPEIISFAPNQKRMTLCEFISKYGAKAETYAAYVETEDDSQLSFAQDLIFSKLVTQQEINKAACAGWQDDEKHESKDDELKHIPGDFTLLRKQIHNGIVTPEIWAAIEAVATPKELGELKKLKLVTAVYYAQANKLTSVDEWINTVIADRGTLANKGGKRTNKSDTRTRAWAALPLEGFIGKVVDTRNQYKAAAKKGDKEAAAKSEMLKLYQNTLYGDFASPWFDIGNTVLANNITARARLGAWMLNKALHTRQSITDGGMYSVQEVAYMTSKAKKPGFDVLSDNTKWNDKDYTRKLAPLGLTNDKLDKTTVENQGQYWQLEYLTAVQKGTVKGTAIADLDMLAMAHIQQFWSAYGLTLPFDIEHKPENTFVFGGYWSKAHYCLKLLLPNVNLRDSGYLYKVRGAKEYSASEGLKGHPTYQLLKAITDGDNSFPETMEYQHKALLKVPMYKKAKASKGYEDYEGKRPGDDVILQRTAKYNNSHFFFTTEADYVKVRDRKARVKNESVQWFERFGDKGISGVHSAMVKGQLR